MSTSGTEQEVSGTYEVDENCKEAAAKVGEFMREYYAPVYEALDVYSKDEPISPEGIVVAFEAALAELVAYDSEWANWRINRNEKIDSLRIDVDEKFIDIGMRRADITAKQLKALFSHEVLDHALRSINGAKLSDELAHGLPDYQDAEEGLGVFIEYAVTGELSEKVVDRYIDIAYALGKIDGSTHTRKELLDHAMKRAINRNAEGSKSIEVIEKEVYTHVNRIYRGSRGVGDVGVITKDISYFKGFMDMGAYIYAQIYEGKSIEEIVAFLTKGKFNPLNQKHIEYMNQT